MAKQKVPGFVIGVAVIVLIFATIFFVLLFSTRIPVGYVGVKVNMYGSEKGIEKKTYGVGRVWYNPFTSDIIKFPTFMQTAVWTRDKREGSPFDESITFQTNDGMTINADVSLQYFFDPSKVPSLYSKFKKKPKDLEATYLRTQVRKMFVDVAANYSVEEFILHKNKFLKDVMTACKTKLEPEGFKIDTLTFIGSPRLPASVKRSIELKIQATQLAEKKKRELEQAKADALKLIAKKEGEAKARIAEAKGKAEAKLIEAKAIAESNRIIAQSLTKELIEYYKIQKWNGVLPQVTGGNGMIFQLPNLKK